MTSYVEAKAALRTALVAALGAGFTTGSATNPLGHVVFDNEPYYPEDGVPYVVATIGTAQPDQPEVGGGAQEHGVMTVTLRYPADAGSGAADVVADSLVRTAFPAKTTLTQGGTKVQVHRPPYAETGYTDQDDGRWVQPVQVPYKLHAA